MVEEALSNYGLYIDDENKIRLIDPERLTDSSELRDECKDFIDSMHITIVYLYLNRFLNDSLRCTGIQKDC